MRASLLCFLVLYTATASIAGESAFPYAAYVATESANAHSGPGEKHYPTGSLQLGATVEVWKHGPEGWLAIRPPAGSFSWVAAKYLTKSDGNVAIVTIDRAPVRVGSVLVPKRDVVQVRLKRGEEVEVLERVEAVASPDGQEWCKIAPPSGEFRWVSTHWVSRQPLPLAKEPAPLIAAESSDVTTVAAAEPVAGETKGGDSAAAEQQSQASPQWTGKASDGPKLGSPKLLTFMNPAQINLALTQMAATEPSEWSLAELRHQTESYMEQAHRPEEREAVQSILDRIARFEQLQMSYASIGKAPPTVAVSNLASNVAITPAIPASSERFDAAGRLTAVVSQRPGTPSYALVEGKDQIQYFVTPAPGVNLQPYLGQTIGIYGQRGFVPELNKPHVTASRISVTRLR